MKSMKKTLCWLVVAAALTMGMAACSSDADSIAEPTIQEPAPTSLHITVGAGIANDNATTRADVVDGTNSNGKATHTLKFTPGDRLFFQKLLESGKFLAGWLTMDGSPSSDGLSATFSGTVKPYNLRGEEISYNLSGIDPLAGSNATLVPKDAPAGCFDDSKHYELYFEESFSIASDVNTLMKTALYVEGSYDDTQQRFNLTNKAPILNCALRGLTPNTAYTVKLRMASEQDNYENNYIIGEITYASMVTTDDLGNAHFAISGKQKELTDDKYWVVQLSSAGHTKDYVIGQKTFEPKIYNLTRDGYSVSAFSYNQAGTEQYIYNTFCLTEATWSTHTDYGLLKFKYMLCTSPGVFESNPPIRSIIISDSDGHIYTVTDTRDNGYGGILNFDTDFQFYVALQPISGKTLTITYDPHNTQFTHTGTIEGVTLAGGDVLNLGTVELMKTNLQ